MMKKLLLIFSCLFLIAACTKDPLMSDTGVVGSVGAVVVGVPEGAVAGTIAVKVTPEAADAIEAATKTRSDDNRSGIDDLDLIFNQIGAEHFVRIIPYDEKYESGYREYGLSYWYSISFDEEMSLETVAAKLKDCSGIAVVEYTRMRKRMNKGPMRPFIAAEHLVESPTTRAGRPMNDPELAYQWHFDNTGADRMFVNKKSGADINLFDAWELCAGGEDIIVAVIDEPVQFTHPDLEANMWTNPKPTEGDLHGKNFWNKGAELDWKSYDKQYNEYADHGSHVAGTIAAVNNNGIGCCGIAGGKNGTGGVKIMSCQIMGYSNKNANNYAAEEALTYAANNGAVIAQCSWGYDAGMSESEWNNTAYGSLRSAIDYFIGTAGSNNKNYPNSPIAGGLVIFAAGNDGDVVKDMKTWPSAYKPIIAVAAMGWDFQPSYFTDYGSWADITAPGGDAYTAYADGNYYDDGQILSTILKDPSMTFRDERDDSGCGYMQGTSMSCPHVSGVAALGLAYASKIGKKFTAREFTALLLGSTHDLSPYLTGTKNYLDSRGAKKTLTLSNYLNKMGRGYVDALGLLLDIKGTPAVYVQKDVATTVDLSKYFGGSPATLTLVNASMEPAALQKLGMTSVPAFKNGTMSFTCTAIGSAMVTVTANVGETSVTREFAIVVRDGFAQNGGWL